ncbi:MAG TPA: tripartite tricarboxylate transporter substrate binding protein, partial [Acetobacteraceae bacterium]|nr:tripartite tricarboxylate transporter substrate binding protein [Acetobacteraceae bacterium]
ARAFPDRPIQLLVGFSAGGNIDIAARMAAPFLERHLGGGASIIVVNRPGAGGAIMLGDFAAARPDGHAIAMVSFPGMVTALHDGAPRYRLDSFAYVGLLTDEPYTLFVGRETPYHTLGDLVAAAHARPEEIAIAGAGAGSAPHLALIGFERASGARFTWVPLPGAGQIMQLVQGGHVMGSVSTVSLTMRPHRTGEIRILALLEHERWRGAPDIPTAREQGFDSIASSARGFALPAATPEPIRRRWEEAIRRTAEDAEFRALAERDFVIVRHLDSAAMTAFARQQHDALGALWQSAPWRR